MIKVYHYTLPLCVFYRYVDLHGFSYTMVYVITVEMHNGTHGNMVKS
jgi:hypothetical protein